MPIRVPLLVGDVLQEHDTSVNLEVVTERL
jgi:hypothetical protein